MYRRIPFGLKTMPATFQRIMNNVLSGLTGTMCCVFLGDIVIYADSLFDHERKLRDVFRRLRRYNIKLQPDKCEFFEKRSNLPRTQNLTARIGTRCSQNRIYQEFPNTQNGETTEFSWFSGVLQKVRSLFQEKSSSIA